MFIEIRLPLPHPRLLWWWSICVSHAMLVSQHGQVVPEQQVLFLRCVRILLWFEQRKNSWKQLGCFILGLRVILTETLSGHHPRGLDDVLSEFVTHSIARGFMTVCYMAVSQGEQDSKTRRPPNQRPPSGFPRRSLITEARSRMALPPSPRNEQPCIVARILGFKVASR